ncbi:MAG: molybdenum cofactor guanylyltransferase [Hyphomicrobiales bacterium]
MEPITQPTGVILAGGKSTRFGADKAAALLLGRPLLQWVADALAVHCRELVVVRAAHQLLPPLDSHVPVRVLDDRYEALGPLAGLVTAFTQLVGPCVVAPCDAPLLRPALLAGLAERLAGHDAVVPVVGGYREPLVAAYDPATCLPVFEAALATGRRGVQAALRGLRVREFSEAEVATLDPGLDSFRNVNDSAALAAIEAVLTGSKPGTPAVNEGAGRG